MSDVLGSWAAAALAIGDGIAGAGSTPAGRFNGILATQKTASPLARRGIRVSIDGPSIPFVVFLGQKIEKSRQGCRAVLVAVTYG